MDYDMESKQAKDFAKAFSISKKYSSRLQHPMGHVLDHVPILPKVAQATAARKTLDSIVYGLISERRNKLRSQKDNTANDLLSRLIQVQGDDDGRIMTDEQLRDEIITILIAGQESVIMI